MFGHLVQGVKWLFQVLNTVERNTEHKPERRGGTDDLKKDLRAHERATLPRDTLPGIRRVHRDQTATPTARRATAFECFRVHLSLHLLFS